MRSMQQKTPLLLRDMTSMTLHMSAAAYTDIIPFTSAKLSQMLSVLRHSIN